MTNVRLSCFVFHLWINACGAHLSSTVYVGSRVAICPRNNAYNYVVSLCCKIDLYRVSLPSACTEEHYVLQPAFSGLHSASQGQWICESHWHKRDHTSHTNDSGLWLSSVGAQGRWEPSHHRAFNPLPLREPIQLTGRVETHSPNLICLPDIQGNGELARRTHVHNTTCMDVLYPDSE